jgi:hypothetical protein
MHLPSEIFNLCFSNNHRLIFRTVTVLLAKPSPDVAVDLGSNQFETDVTVGSMLANLLAPLILTFLHIIFILILNIFNTYNTFKYFIFILMYPSILRPNTQFRATLKDQARMVFG